ncbi:hypothetical protein L3i20_v248450 [Paenibacillus sp. L3-i20]|nr:hypothetical protein L3i20_v248450 [Paenibacillus sp. L3-i20]
MLAGLHLALWELELLWSSPSNQAHLRTIVFSSGQAMGLIDMDEGSLKTLAGKICSMGDNDSFVVVHPYYLAANDTLNSWKNEYESIGKSQPFEQIHRGLYLLETTERVDEYYMKTFMMKTFMLYGMRSTINKLHWVIDRKEMNKTYNRFDVKVKIEIGLNSHHDDNQTTITLKRVNFEIGKSGELLALNQVPPVVFSETMRDINRFLGI